MVTVQLSNKALDVLKSNPSMLQEQFSQLFNGLNDWEQNMILSSLQRLVNLLNAEDIKSPPVLVSGPITASFQDVHRYLGEDELKVK
jgi:hypothetical protein